MHFHGRIGKNLVSTDLIFEITIGYESIVRRLVENDADLNVVSRYNDTALNLAVKGGNH